jgi:hypothetical protein
MRNRRNLLPNIAFLAISQPFPGNRELYKLYNIKGLSANPPTALLILLRGLTGFSQVRCHIFT